MERLHPAVVELCSTPLDTEDPETVTRLLEMFEMSYSLTGFYKFGSSLLPDRKSPSHGRWRHAALAFMSIALFSFQENFLPLFELWLDLAEKKVGFHLSLIICKVLKVGVVTERIFNFQIFSKRLKVCWKQCPVLQTIPFEIKTSWGGSETNCDDIQLTERIERSLSCDQCLSPEADIKSTTSAGDLTTAVYHVSQSVLVGKTNM